MSAQLALSLPAPTPISSQRVLLLTPEAESQAAQRLAILRMALDYRDDPNRFGRLQLGDGTLVTSFSKMLEYAAEVNGVSVRTLKRWLSDYRNGGLPELADRQRADKGRSRFFSQYPKAAWLVAYLFLECKQSAKVCYEAVIRDGSMLEIPADELPAYETVRAWLKSMPPSLVVYARNGRKAYRERMAPYLKHGHAEYSNQIWVGDHMIHDVECMNDCFDDAEYGAPIRIRLSAMIDFRSRMVMGASWCWEGSSRAIAATMRRAISKYGPPEHIYVDNGKDYRKAARGALPGYLAESSLAPTGWWNAELDSIAASGFMARLGIAVTHCLPHHPQSKNVERFFRTLHERFDKVWPTYTSGSPFTRPEATEARMMQHRRLLKAGRVSESNHPRATQVVGACLAWMEEYADTPHTGQGLDGGTPRQVFEANLNPNQKPSPDYPTLTLLMAERTKRLVRECAVTLAKRRYVPADPAGWAALHEMNEREIFVAYDPADLDAAAAVDQDGNFMAWLQAESLVRFAPGDPKTQERIAESMGMRRRLEKGNRDTIALVTRTALANGAQSPLEAMAGRLRLSAGETGRDVLTQRNQMHVEPAAAEPENRLIPGQAADRLAARLRRTHASNS